MQYGNILKHMHSKKKPIKTIKIFLYALGFAISQGGIAARTLTLMQGSEEKKTNRKSSSSRDMPLHSARLEPECETRQTHAYATISYHQGIALIASKCRI